MLNTGSACLDSTLGLQEEYRIIVFVGDESAQRRRAESGWREDFNNRSDLHRGFTATGKESGLPASWETNRVPLAGLEQR
jgi:hypothetical protein